jgi:hypothetical protein
MVAGVDWSPAIMSSDTVCATAVAGVTTVTDDSLTNTQIN